MSLAKQVLSKINEASGSTTFYDAVLHKADELFPRGSNKELRAESLTELLNELPKGYRVSKLTMFMRDGGHDSSNRNMSHKELHPGLANPDGFYIAGAYNQEFVGGAYKTKDELESAYTTSSNKTFSYVLIQIQSGKWSQVGTISDGVVKFK